MTANAHIPHWVWPAGYANKNKAYPFSLLLGLSLLVHLLVLAGWSSSPVKQIELALPVADFAVQLEHDKRSAVSKIPQPPSPSFASKTPAIIPKPVIPVNTQPVSVPEQTHVIHQQAAIAVATPGHPAQTTEEKLTTETQPPTRTEKPTAARNHNRVISRLQDKLKQYFYYPRLAQRKNIQGTVVIGFAINLRGTLTNIRVVKSSGFAILDIAAEEALIKVHHLDASQNWATDKSDLELPVIYKLTEG